MRENSLIIYDERLIAILTEACATNKGWECATLELILRVVDRS